MRGVTVSLDERRLVRALRAGEETAYARLHELYDARLEELAVAHGCSRAVAQEVVQETWTAVVRNIRSFEGRSSLKTWIFRILVNAANAQAKRERKSVPFSPEVVVDLDHERSRRRTMPPEDQLVLRETVAHVHAAIGRLTPSQRHVITLRDVHGWTAEDVSGRLGISRGHQRVLLHRARAHVRRSLSEYLDLPSESAA
jgi:RNA polymerase sigma-70 factor (ECF subfamily)